MKLPRIRRAPVWLGLACAAGLVVVLGRAGAPPGRYTITAGTVYDTKTKLTWQQAVPGSAYSWSGAKSYCASLSLNGTGWRLPSMKELETIVDFSRTGPPIDTTAFASTPAAWFWTSSNLSTDSSVAWYVDFGSPGDGGAYYTAVSTLSRIRCVR